MTPTPGRPSYRQLYKQLMAVDRDRSRILMRYEDRYGIGSRANTAADRDPQHQAAQQRYDEIRRQMPRVATVARADRHFRI